MIKIFEGSGDIRLVFELLMREVDVATGITLNFPGLFVLFNLLTAMDHVLYIWIPVLKI